MPFYGLLYWSTPMVYPIGLLVYSIQNDLFLAVMKTVHNAYSCFKSCKFQKTYSFSNFSQPYTATSKSLSLSLSLSLHIDALHFNASDSL